VGFREALANPPCPDKLPLMDLVISLSQSDFAKVLDGNRDFDFGRNLEAALTNAVKAAATEIFSQRLVSLQMLKVGLFSSHAGRINSPAFSVAAIKSEGHFFAAGFHYQMDVEGEAVNAIKSVKAGSNIDFFGNFGGIYEREGRPRLTFKAMRRAGRYTLKLDSLRIAADLLPFTNSAVKACSCPDDLLRPTSNWPGWGKIMSWTCILCGKKWLCRSGEFYLESLCNRSGYDNHPFINLRGLSNFREGVSHWARGVPSETRYRAEFYGSLINQFYYPYILQEAATQGVDNREGENLVRDKLGIPRIGEGWATESMLINTVKYLFPTLSVHQQASPEWLGRQRFDGFIPEYSIALEYNGEQHYQPVSVFGGDAGLAATQARDRRKLALAAENGVEVVIFRFDETLSEELIARRVSKAIERQLSKTTDYRGILGGEKGD
jgi:hypothetical protein